MYSVFAFLENRNKNEDFVVHIQRFFMEGHSIFAHNVEKSILRVKTLKINLWKRYNEVNFGFKWATSAYLFQLKLMKWLGSGKYEWNVETTIHKIIFGIQSKLKQILVYS